MSANVAASITPRDAREWEIRTDLAACYRLLHRYRMTDLIYTHVSARLPDTDGHFLLNPYGLRFDEITASSLVEVDREGNVVGDSEWGVNWAGYIIHGAILHARDDLNCVLHTHTRAGVAVACLKEGVLPISQHALQFYNRIGYHDYEGFANEREECARLAANLGDHKALIMRNHGLLVADHSVGQAWVRNYNLEMSCMIQLDVMRSGGEIVYPDAEVAEFVAREYEIEKPFRSLAWQALIRQLDDEDPSYRD